MRRAARTDGNHKQIVHELRQAGLTVYDISRMGNGIPDLIVCRTSRVLLVEVKDKGGRLTPDEVRFFEECPDGCAIVARSAEDVLVWFGLIVPGQR